MASIVLRIDERVVKNGMSPIRVRVSHNHTAAWYQTGVSVEPSCFQSGSIYDPIGRRAYMAAEKRAKLLEMVRRWDDGLMELQKADGGDEQIARMNATELRDYIFGEKKVVRKASAAEMVRKRKTGHVSDFLSWFDQYGQGRQSERTREHFAYVSRVLNEYTRARGLQGLTFADINYERLTDMKAWLRGRSSGEPTRFKVESYVRAAYREGQRFGKCDRSHDPYLDYKIEKVPEKDIVTISRDEMHTLMLAPLKERPGLQRAKDVLMASFYLCGANFVDLYDMPAPVNGEVQFVRHKVAGRTQKKTCIRVEPELEEITARYGGDGRLLNFTANMRSLQYRMCDNYVELSKELGFKVNMEIIRRTWATLAAEIECPDTVIDMCMGHVARSVNSRFYVKPDWRRAAKWNRRVIDYVLKLDADDSRADV